MKKQISPLLKLFANAALLVIAFSVIFASCSKTDTFIAPDGVPEILAVNNFYENEESYHLQEWFPFDRALYVSCANGGQGEYVWFSGTMHFTEQLTVRGESFTLAFQGNSSGVRGVGSITGDEYVCNGVGHEVVNGSFTNGQFTGRFTDRMQVTGRGPGNNVLLLYTARITITRSGEVRTEMEDLRLECR